tara:strand:+ start:8836 stop:9402 length:567 start_codon:yes stop_codon:yes gene_type:complete
MIKFGITGSIASGKTTASRILSRRYGPLFSADKAVKELYQSKKFKLLISKKFNLKNDNQLKNSVKKLVIKKKTNLKKLEKIIHPLVRKKMRAFTLKNKSRGKLFYEIPLLIESKLTKLFNIIIFIKSKKQTRMRRFKKKNGNKRLFNFLNNQQMSDKKKIKFCDHIIVNDSNLNILKRNLFNIIKKYE